MAENEPETFVAEELEPNGPVVAEPVQAYIPPNRPRKVNGGMWGPLEIAVVAFGALAVFGAILLYVFMVIPSNREVAKNRSEADRLDAEVLSANSKYGEATTTEAKVANLVSSVDDFETRFLPLPSIGQPALYQKINGLILANGLTNTTGPDYAPLETAEQNVGQQTDDEKGRSKFRSLYPGVYVSTTLEGSYQNLRRFIREVETGNEFVIISAVELAPSDTEGQKESPAANANANVAAPPPVNSRPAVNSKPMMFPNSGFPNVGMTQPMAQRPAPKGKTHGDVVSLHIEMAAYFRRPNYSPVSSSSH